MYRQTRGRSAVDWRASSTRDEWQCAVHQESQRGRRVSRSLLGQIQGGNVCCGKELEMHVTPEHSCQVYDRECEFYSHLCISRKVYHLLCFSHVTWGYTFPWWVSYDHDFSQDREKICFISSWHITAKQLLEGVKNRVFTRKNRNLYFLVGGFSLQPPWKSSQRGQCSGYCYTSLPATCETTREGECI